MILGALLFAISTAFPVIASLIPAESAAPWMGIVDVALAFVIVVVAFLIDALARGKITADIIHLSYRIYRGVVILPLALLVIFFLAGEAIRWNILLPGLAWRAWVSLYVLPSALTLWRASGAQTNVC